MPTRTRSIQARVPSPSPPGTPLRNLERIAWVMDRAVKVPGLPVRFGLDAVLGLVPIGGDALAGAIQAGVVMAAMFYYRVPRAVAARMAANVLLDVAVGSIPFLGDAFDVAFKANTRNLALLREVEQERAETGRISSKGSILYLAGLALVLIAALSLLLVGAYTLLSWILSARG